MRLVAAGVHRLVARATHEPRTGPVVVGFVGALRLGQAARAPVRIHADRRDSTTHQTCAPMRKIPLRGGGAR